MRTATAAGHGKPRSRSVVSTLRCLRGLQCRALARPCALPSCECSHLAPASARGWRLAGGEGRTPNEGCLLNRQRATSHPLNDQSSGSQATLTATVLAGQQLESRPSPTADPNATRSIYTVGAGTATLRFRRGYDRLRPIGDQDRSRRGLDGLVRLSMVRVGWTCASRRHCPGGTAGRFARLVLRRQPSPEFRRVGSRIGSFEVCSAFTARCGLHTGPVAMRPSTPEASASSPPPQPLRSLLAGATVARMAH